MSPTQGGYNQIEYNRRTFLRTIPLTAILATSSGLASAQPQFPDRIPLPTGFQPEGIVTGRGTTFFVGSRVSGAVYRGDLRTGEGEVLVPAAEDRVAIGLSHDPRSNNLFVSGGGTGKGYVFDASTGAPVATYTLTDPRTFVNDVVVTTSAAYFTDSFRSFLYKVPLGPAGQLAEQSEVNELSLGGEFQSVSGFNTNGIDTPPNAEFLIIVNSSTGLLYTVDPVSGDANEIDLGGETVMNGDGILLDGHTLYVVRNRNNVISVVDLEPGAMVGSMVGEITDAAFDVPTTVAEFGDDLYAVNARFGTGSPEDAAYNVIRVPKQRRA